MPGSKGVHNWRHGWIPLTPEATQQKDHGRAPRGPSKIMDTAIREKAATLRSRQATATSTGTTRTGPEEAGAAAEHHFHTRDLTSGERHAVADYQGTGYRVTNRYLSRGQDSTGGGAERVANLQGAIDGNHTTRRIVVVRGLDEDAAPKVFGDKSTVGKTFTDTRFVSTSTRREVAAKFSGPNGALLHYHLPAGHPAMSVNHALRDASDAPDEHEVLLPHGQKWRVTKDIVRKGKPREVHLAAA